MQQVKKNIKFIILSLLAIWVFFIPSINNQVFLVYIVNYIKNSLNHFSNIIVISFSIAIVISLLLGRCFNIQWFKRRHSKDHPIEIVSYFVALICELLIFFNIGGPFILNENVGGQVFSLAYTVLITIIVSGIFVTLVIKSGLVEFIACLSEPFMRKLFKVPGSAAIDCLSSFVSAASVGIYITNELYENKKYTEREACIIASCFSIMSLGFMIVLTEMAGIADLASYVIISSFIIMVILGIICSRIPPLSNKKNIYIDGTYPDEGNNKKCQSNSLKYAWDSGINKASGFKMSDVFDYFVNSLLFAQKVIVVLIPLMMVVLLIATYTPCFEWIGKVVSPILVLLGLPNAEEIAPATIIGITEVTLPVISIVGLDIEIKSIFFVTVLSIVQVIYFTESANAILSSSIPLKIKDLIYIFFIRTIIGIPLVAVITHLFDLVFF
jgi:nucleoside recognition membrane protein YjiH